MERELIKGIQSITNDRMLKIIVEVLKYKIKQMQDFHQITYEEAKILVLDELTKELI